MENQNVIYKELEMEAIAFFSNAMQEITRHDLQWQEVEEA